ncbi:MAG: hypothetical protein FJX40_11225 [Alphaproteobacteria bacterium]|nr:hypothetical protein [Alphaproteobacteria bacterium]MBM3640891.1 hypothetical protein [Alphaproteobacteria bacterium]
MTKLELIEMSADEEAMASLCNATNNLREYFQGEVLAALPGFARKALEREIEFLADKPGDFPWPPLANLTMERGEQCLRDIIAYNHDGAASDHFRDCVNETVEAVVAAIND